MSPLRDLRQRSVETASGSIHIESAGTGERSLIALTPIGAEWLAESLPEGLCDLFSVHMVELPGTGRSPAPEEPPSVESLARAMAAVGGFLAPDRPPFLFGHSMNGALALFAAGHMPCAGVIAVTPPARLPPDMQEAARYWETQAEPERKARAADLGAGYSRAGSEEERARLTSRLESLRRWWDLDFDSSALDGLGHADMAWMASVFGSGAGVDWGAAYRGLSCPVLLIFGRYDFIAPPTCWTDELYPPRSTIRMFERSSHTPFLEEPQEFLDVVADWLTVPR